jgi:hypothetical protein
MRGIAEIKPHVRDDVLGGIGGGEEVEHGLCLLTFDRSYEVLVCAAGAGCGNSRRKRRIIAPMTKINENQ